MSSKAAFLFPGQGSQYVGMGKAAYDAHPQAREVFDAADAALGLPLSALCFEGPEEVLTDTINAQPAILATSIAYLRVFQASGKAPEPAFLAGHSLGEYTALVAAGALSLEEGVKLVRERGRLMKKAGEANPGKMAAIIGLDTDVVEEICAQASGDGELDSVCIANYNCPGQIVISGAVDAVERAVELAIERNARRAIPLAVSIASHSPLMRSAVPGLRQAVNGLSIGACSKPVIANVSARAIETPEEIADELAAQLTSSVRWTESMEHLIGEGMTEFHEIGPKNVLSGLMRRISRDAAMIVVESELGLA